MRNILIFLSVILINAIVYILVLPQTSLLKKEAIYIAAALPAGTPRGEAILMGINAYVDKINKQGGIDNRKIELLIYDDKNDPETARDVASRIVAENRALLVLGHYKSSASVNAGTIYKINEIPAITASATEESVTMGNDWYFRIVPNNKMQAAFVANYIYRTLKMSSASIIFSKDAFGLSFVRAFDKTAKKLGMEIKNKWAWEMDGDPDEQAKKITDELKAADDPGTILFATHSTEGVKIITALGDEAKSYTIIGTDAFERSFVTEVKKYSQEMSDPGRYTDGIYFVSPFIGELASAQAYISEQEFPEIYKISPSWVTACYYDAAKVAVQAIKKAGIHGKGHVRKDRRRVRRILKSFYSQEHSVSGITGDIYFDDNGDIKKPHNVGFFWKHKILPAFSQYRQIFDIKHFSNIINHILNGEIIAGDIFMKSIRVVYVGMDIIEISSIDMNNSEYAMDFYLWFRYSGEFDGVTDIEVINAADPVKLGKPEREETKGDITMRKYRIKANLKADFDFSSYPFGHQVIPLRFRHNSQTRESLIYVPDTSFLPEHDSAVMYGWKAVGEPVFYQDALIRHSSLGNPKYFDSKQAISYSRFNAEIRIKRRNPGLFVFKRFFPIMSMLLALYWFVWFSSPARLFRRVWAIMIILGLSVTWDIFTGAELYTDYYLTAIDYAFFTLYAFIIISAFISVHIFRLHQQGDEKKTKDCILAGKIAYPSVISVTGLLFFYIYGL